MNSVGCVYVCVHAYSIHAYICVEGGYEFERVGRTQSYREELVRWE